MANLQVSSNNHACPICDNTTGKCRSSKQDSHYWQCMTLTNLRPGEVVNGYKFLKLTSDGTWGQFRFNTGFGKSTTWRPEKPKREPGETTKTEFKKARSLTPQQRHEEYSRLLDELTLHPDDRADLVKRGFTEDQIIRCGFKSVELHQKLKGEYSPLLSGMGEGKLLISRSGYLIPVRDHDGFVTGCQIRVRQLAEDDDNRYRWLSTQHQTLHLWSENSHKGELPLAVFPHPEATQIALVEGVGAKPFLVSERLKAFVIGAGGGQWASSPKLFKKALDKAESQTGEKRIVIYPDGGDVLNKTVMTRWRRIINLLTDWGWSVYVAWWGQVQKDHPDVDELEIFSGIQYLTPQEFDEASKELEKRNRKISDKNSIEWRNWIEFRRFTPTITLNQKYFEFPSNIPVDNAILAGLDGLGGGKTSALIRLIARLGKGSRLIGYRNTLLHQTISRFKNDAGIPYYHLIADGCSLLLRDKDSHVAFCLDSIHRSQPECYKDTVIILDETVSVLLHAITAGTLGGRQSEALATLRGALQACDLVVCLDGNLRDIDIDLIQQLSGGKEVVKIQNEYKREPHNITFVTGVDPEGELKKRDRSPLVKAMIHPDCKPWIVCDSKDRALDYAEMLRQTGKTGYVLCSETKNEPWAREFLADPTAFIKKYKPDFMSISPSGESGLDCHGNGHFTHKFSFFSGVLATNAQTQIMFRLRDNLPHFVFCPDRGMVKDRNTPNTYNVQHYEKASNDYTQQSAELVWKIPMKDYIQNIIAKMLDNADPDYWRYSNVLGAFDNFEIDNLRECLIYALKESGHKIEEVQWEICEETQTWEQEVFDWLQATEAKEKYAAKDITFKEAQKLKRKDGTKEINRQVQKAFFISRLPNINQWEGWDKIIKPDEKGFPIFDDFYEGCDILRGGELLFYIDKKERGYISSLERFWQLKNYDIAHKRHEKRWLSFSEKDEMNKIEARKRGTAFSTIWALHELNLLSFLDGEWCCESPELIELEERGHNPDIVLALGFSPDDATDTNKQRISYLRKLLDLIGCRLDSPVRKGTEKRTRFYKILKNLKESKLFKGFEKRGEPIPRSLWFDDWESPIRVALMNAIDFKFTAWGVENQAELEWNPESPLERKVREERESTIDDLIFDLRDCEDIYDLIRVTTGYDNELVDEAIAKRNEQQPELMEWWQVIKDVQTLRSAKTWDDLYLAGLTQERMACSWGLLTIDERDRLRQLSTKATEQPQQEPVQKQESVTIEDPGTIDVVVETHPPLSIYQQFEKVWAYIPHIDPSSNGGSKWAKCLVEMVGSNFIRVKMIHGLLGALIERPDEVVPEDWVFT